MPLSLSMSLDAEKHRRIREMSEQALKVMEKKREELERLIDGSLIIGHRF